MGSGNVGREEKGGGDIPPPCWRSDPEGHAGRAGRDGPAAGAQYAGGQGVADRVAGLAVWYEEPYLAVEEGQFGRGSDGDGSKVVGAARFPRDSTVRAGPGSWRDPRPSGKGMKGSEEGALPKSVGGQARGRVAPVE